jgi:hypothetical protein
MKEGVTMTERLQGQILKQLNGLPDDQQRQVLEFARTLVKSSPAGVPGKELLRFAGLIPEEDLKQMNAAIEQGCERVEAHEW